MNTINIGIYPSGFTSKCQAYLSIVILCRGKKRNPLNPLTTVHNFNHDYMLHNGIYGAYNIYYCTVNRWTYYLGYTLLDVYF